MKQSVEYLGHSVDSQGLHTMPEAIQQAPEPENVRQLRSILGL